ncbi:hypothetical protein N474_19180 [Pseudoalteromonas luteoviolacea CPMOR-2]|uniref:Uncharacterized protein n=1 Tax=Pseudoalteromonas luteoviolacea DSM 6061 TaxID=1365250 RepID=A0A166W7G6_9GAMM|nr:hypothetical protein N475_17970 [Pseudoalteromonas luteoviolacea DSM 6061]KZN53837.1 hypothetical protein N474_19180 [Pseudoalteromonas luteoviolacea CPMOR-2]MBE0390172.1 hypothetical protein [Pseudoalteromonas luteoviolacea DSM 6061]
MKPWAFEEGVYVDTNAVHATDRTVKYFPCRTFIALASYSCLAFIYY